MGIFSRFRRMLKSNVNSMISKSENPEKMLSQVIVDMNQQLIESKKINLISLTNFPTLLDQLDIDDSKKHFVLINSPICKDMK